MKLLTSRNIRVTSLPASLALAATLALLPALTGRAANYTYTSVTGSNNWSTGTGWNTAPVSGSTTTLIFTGTYAASANVVSNNDNVSFQLNALSVTSTGPASGTAPSLTIQGNQLEFISNSGTNPTLTLNTSGVIKPTVTISNALLLTNNLTVAATTNGTLSGAISGGGSLTKSGVGTVILTGSNGYSGVTTVSTGVLDFGNVNALYGGGTSSWTSTNLRASSGATMAFGVGSGPTYFTASNLDLIASGTGIVSGALIGIDTSNAGGSFTYNTSFAVGVGIAKLGSGTLNYGGTTSGPVTIDGGTLAFTVDNNNVKTLTFGAAALSTNVGTLDLTNASLTATNNMVVQTNSTGTNAILIGSGKTLTVNGGLNMGFGVNPNSSGSITNLAISGSGSLIFNKSGGTFQVGSQNGTTNVGDNGCLLDMSNLASASIDMGSTGVVRVCFSGNGGGGTSPEIAKLAVTSTIKAGTLGISDTGGQGNINALYLGSGTQTLQVNTINMGTNGRPNSLLQFNTGTGSVTITGYAGGVSTANLTMGVNTSTTGGNTVQTFDVSGHTATISLGDLKMASRNAVTSASTESDTFKFDTGTLNVANQAILANTTGTSGLNVTSNVASITLGGGSIGDGSFNFTNGLSLAQNARTSGTGTSTATLTINGNTGYAFTGTSGAITMATTAGTTGTGNRATASLILNGGTLTMTGDIAAGGTGAGIASSTVTLAGGTLDMGSHNLGNAGGLINTLNFQSGTLKNVGQINNGAGLTKTGTGTLTIDGSNSYTGNTQVNAGKLNVIGTLNGSVITVGTGASLAGSGAIGAGLVTLNSGNAGINLQNGTGATLTLSNGLTLNNGNLLSFDIGSTSDSIALTGTGAYTFASGTATVNIANIAGYTQGTYTLISGATGLNASSFTLGTPVVGGLTLSLSGSGGSLLLTALNPVAYWKGGTDANWNTLNSGTTNWTTDAGGTVEAGSVPGGGLTVVHFAASGAGNLGTTLGADFNIDSLVFESSVGTVSIGGSNTLTLYSVYSGTGIAVNTGAGPVTLGSDMTLAFVTNQVWTNNSANGLTVNSQVAGNGISLTLTGTGLTVLGGSNSYSGGTTVTNGTVQLGNAGALGSGTAALAVNGGTLDLNGYSPTVGLFSGSSAGLVTTTSTGSVVLAASSASNSTYAGSISNGSGTVGLAKAAGGTLTLSGSSSYSGGTAVNGGYIVAGNNSALGSGAVIVDSSASLAIGAGVTIPNAITAGGNGVNSNNLTVNGSGTGTISGPITWDTGSGTTWRIDPGTGNTLNITGTISGGSTSQQIMFNRGSTGTVILGAQNTYAGGGLVGAATNIYNGTLKIGVDNALPGSALISYSSASSTFDLFGHNQTIESFTSGVATTVGRYGVITNSGTGLAILTLNNQLNQVSMNGNLTAGYQFNTAVVQDGVGGIALVKTGTATTTFIKAGNYTHGTTVNGGILTGLQGTAFGSGDVTVNTSGTLNIDFNAFATTSGSQTLTDTVAGKLVLNGGNMILNARQNAAGGALNATATRSGGGNPSAGNFFTMTSGDTSGLAVGQVVTGTANIPANDYIVAILDSTHFLTSQNFATQVTVNSGLTVSAVTNTTTQTYNHAEIDSASTVTVNNNGSSGTLIFGDLTGVGALNKDGDGTLLVNGTGNFSGNLAVNAGVLTASNSIASTTITTAALATLNLNGGVSGTTAAITSNGVTNIGASSTLSSLNIGTTGTATLTAHTGGAGNVKVLDLSSLTISGTTPFAGGGAKETGIVGNESAFSTLGERSSSEAQLAASGLISPAPVPEPGTVALLTIGAIGGWLLRRRGSNPDSPNHTT